MKEAGPSAKGAASMGQGFASEVAMKAATQALQIHGGAGYITEFPIERIFRDAKLTEIGEGTSEVQRMVIARDMRGGRSQRGARKGSGTGPRAAGPPPPCRPRGCGPRWPCRCPPSWP